MQRITQVAITALGVWLAAACSINSPQRAAPENQARTSAAPFIHKVRYTGETLELIASWYTGSRSNWRKILASNPRAEPNRLKLGERIVIPGQLLRRAGALPRSLVESSRKPFGFEQEGPGPRTSARSHIPPVPASVDQEPVTPAPTAPPTSPATRELTVAPLRAPTPPSLRPAIAPLPERKSRDELLKELLED